ncbi:hypothetical protein TNCT_80541 [Trichonephila clavata]|uniref:Uncharacterized protein n=1 Tax=Trichonephila clavata TaxID=2740835 RepID=A0A8X6JJC4_TRICU|nr:hypothetical protein TNCT_80541 [Trichonephila clavata]
MTHVREESVLTEGGRERQKKKGWHTVSFAHEERSVKPSRPCFNCQSEYRKCVSDSHNKGTAPTTTSSAKSVIGKCCHAFVNPTLEWKSLWWKYH